MSKVVIFGAGDYARIARIYLDRDSEHEVVAFTVNESYIEASTIDGLPLVPFEQLEQTHPPGDFEMLVAAGFSKVNEVRARIYEECRARDYSCITYVNSKAIHWGPNKFGENTFIFEANVIQPNVEIGDNTVLWSGNHIGHDAIIGSHVFIASHAVISGSVEIGDYCFVGVNATFRDGVRVAPRCVIGASALIMKDTEEGAIHSVPGTKALDKKSWDLENF